MNTMNQYGGFNFTDPGGGLSVVSQQSMGQPGQAMPMQMVTVAALPASAMCAMSNLPVNVQCPLCQFMTTTSVEKEVGLRAKLSAFAFVLAGCCCLIPLFWNNLKDTVHYCGNCQTEIGRYVGQGGTAGRRRRR